MSDAVPKKPPGFSARGKLLEWIEQQLGGHTVQGMELCCNPNRPHKTLCVIDGGTSAATEVCKRLGGKMYGAGTAILFLPLAPSFSCEKRPEGKHLTATHCECWPGIAKDLPSHGGSPD